MNKNYNSSEEPALSQLQKKLKLNSITHNALHYRELMLGDNGGWLALGVSQLYALFMADLPGVSGLLARRFFLPRLLGSCGKGLIVEKSVTFRQLKKFHFANNIAIDEYVAITAKGEGSSITLGNNVLVGRFSSIVAKSGRIVLNSGVNISSHCRLATQSELNIGDSTLIAAYCYLGPGNHQFNNQSDNIDLPMIERPMEIKSGTHIGKNCWIGAGSIVLDGVTLGDNVVVGANSLVKDSFPDNSIIGGTPARSLKKK